MGSSNDVYDFIIVGSGPAGAAIAGRLAQTKSAPKVLLLEAGGKGSSNDRHETWERYQTFALYPEDARMYQTGPNVACDDRTLPYPRGKVLGGSSVVNFSAWTVGPKDDFDRWASEVGDKDFDWQHRAAMSKLIEAFDSNISPEYREYAQPDMSVHGIKGRIGVTYPKTWEKGAVDRLLSEKEAGWPLNKDINDGDPIGAGPLPSSNSNSGHRTLATSYLKDAGSNLTVTSDTLVTKILFDGKKAVGVRTIERQYRASKEVVISCGALESPKLLMLSGIGPQDELDKHHIKVLTDLPGVGRGLEEHPFCRLVWREKNGSHSDWAQLLSNPDAMTKAKNEFRTLGTGPLLNMYTGTSLGYFKADELLNEPAFKSLPAHVQEHMRKPTVPLYEVAVHVPPNHPKLIPGESYFAISTFVFCPSSRGSVTLASTDPKDNPVIDLNLLDNPADRAIGVASARKILDFAETPSIKKDIIEPFLIPASRSDEDIESFWRQNTVPAGHASSTVKMGRSDDKSVCLDSSFRVRGVQNLRVADMSSAPFVPNCHTQSVAYFIGETAAAKLIDEYKL